MIRTYTRRFLRSLPPPHARDVVDGVRELVQLLLPLRRCTMPRVARALGVTKRTLHRLLAARQESFAAIVDDGPGPAWPSATSPPTATPSPTCPTGWASPRPARLPMVATAVRDQPDRLGGGDHRIRHPDLTGGCCRPAQPGPPRTAACPGCALPSR